MSMILASASPRRRELLAMIQPDFTVIPSQFDEDGLTAQTPALLAQRLAEGKCLWVAENHPEDLVIGCDTVVDIGGRVLGKPKDRQAARQMLTALSGTEHRVHTGVCIRKGSQQESCVVTTTVRFWPLSEQEIEAYIATEEPYDKAGGYGIQGHAALFCEQIRGCYYNVVGFPVSKVARMLKKFE